MIKLCYKWEQESDTSYTLYANTVFCKEFKPVLSLCYKEPLREWHVSAKMDYKQYRFCLTSSVAAKDLAMAQIYCEGFMDGIDHATSYFPQLEQMVGEDDKLMPNPNAVTLTKENIHEELVKLSHVLDNEIWVRVPITDRWRG
jgi:hypothetical protein